MVVVDVIISCDVVVSGIVVIGIVGMDGSVPLTACSVEILYIYCYLNLVLSI